MTEQMFLYSASAIVTNKNKRELFCIAISPVPYMKYQKDIQVALVGGKY